MEQSEEWLAGRKYLEVAALEESAELDREEVLAASKPKVRPSSTPSNYHSATDPPAERR